MDCRFVVVLIVWSSTFAANSSGTSYTFVNIVDNTGPFLSFNGQDDLDINDSGIVAFKAYYDDYYQSGRNGIFAAAGGPVTIVADSEGPINEFKDLSINDLGFVAFTGRDKFGRWCLFSSSDGDGMVTTVYNSDGPFNWFSDPVINNHGNIAFWAYLDGGGQGVFVGNGGPTTTIADRQKYYSYFDSLDLNNRGTLAFWGEIAAGGSGIYVSQDGIRSTTVETQPEGNLLGFGAPDINESGATAFSARYLDNSEIILVAQGNTLRPFANSLGPIREFTDLGINDRGAIAFAARLDSGSRGIYTGNDIAADKVIEILDPMFGSTVSHLSPKIALNNSGAIAFEYVLADGRLGIAVAHPVPEQSSWLLSACWLVTLVRRIGRNRRLQARILRRSVDAPRNRFRSR